MFSKTAVAFTLASLAGLAVAQPDGPVPRLNLDPKNTDDPRLVGKRFSFRELPYKVDTGNGERGVQEGYNQCNDTTAGPNSMCQTLIVNSLKDFCIWGPPERGTIGDTEHNNVAWCTQPNHGSRVIPEGTITGAQYVRTPSYVAIVGYFNQEKLNIPANDEGGELDSGGQDMRGNPLGAMVYSNSLPSSMGQLTQAPMWHAFLGSGMFCMKFCDEKAPNASGLCRHVYDTLGCYPNIPWDYEGNKNVFLSCEGEDQDPVTPDNTRIPATSKCVTYQSTDLWGAAAAQPTGSQTAQPTNPAPAPTVLPSGSQSVPPSGSQTIPAAPTGTPSGSNSVTPVTRPTTTRPLTASSPSASNPGDAALPRTASMGLVGGFLALLASAILA